MIMCKKYDMDTVDFSIDNENSDGNIGKKFKIVAGTATSESTMKKEEERQKKAKEADRVLRWLKTGNKEGLDYYTDIQLEEIKKQVERFDYEFKRDGIDKDNHLEVLAYIYTKLHYRTLYKNPKVLTGDWGTVVENNNIYGGLVEKYAPCYGIASTAELLAKFYGINAKTIGVNNAGVAHAINGVELESGRFLFFDIANSIGMTVDGRYDGHFSDGTLSERSTYLYSDLVNINDFGLRHKPIFDSIIYKTEKVQPELISDIEKLDAFNGVAEKINAHRLEGSKIKIKCHRTKIQAGIYKKETTPEEISQTVEQYVQENPGQLSPNVRKARGVFARVKECFKELKEK